MKLYCTVDNLGYGEVVDAYYDGKENIKIDLKFYDDSKTFILNKAAGKSLFVDDKRNPGDKGKVIEMIYKKLGEKTMTDINGKIMDYRTNKNKDKIHEILIKNYRFEGFMHETTINNLASILKDGKIKPRNELNSFEDSANNEVIFRTSDEVKSSVRFYFFKKTPTNYHFDAKSPNKMAYIVLKWDIVELPGATFVNGNASSEYSESKEAVEYFKNPGKFMDWNSIAHRGYLPTDDECMWTGGFEDKNDIIRKRNAEINIPNSVKTDYIDKIVFKTKEEYTRFIKILNNDIILNRFFDKIIVDASYFN